MINISAVGAGKFRARTARIARSCRWRDAAFAVRSRVRATNFAPYATILHHRAVSLSQAKPSRRSTVNRYPLLPPNSDVSEDLCAESLLAVRSWPLSRSRLSLIHISEPTRLGM